MKTSAPFMASERVPLKPSVTHPSISNAIIVLAPLLVSNREIAVPAAPAPLITILILDKSLFTNFKELVKAAKTTIAVPCWSS
ncbi:unannotated protein [freshwater metagenome]|uniref:Unannotated protein n=1 Tax=freshwater metagenome TaxID=449393 RepID=A0A6J6FTR6_9ZZZZ